jgi:hypothetical protein
LSDEEEALLGVAVLKQAEVGVPVAKLTLKERISE